MFIKLSGSLAGVAASAFLVSNKINAKQRSEDGFIENRLGPSTEVKNAHNWNYNWDFRDPKTLKRNQTATDKVAVPHKARHVYLIRHGQYQMDKPADERWLTKLGEQQATMTGQRLKRLNIKFDKVYISTMPRAKQTGKLILNELPADRVAEVQHCSLLPEGSPVPPDPPSGRFRSPKYFFQDGARIEAAFRKYFYRADPEQTKPEHIVIVCHANVIRYFICRALQVPEEAWLRFSLKNGSITHLEIRPSGRVIARSIGDAGFMPPEMITTK